MCTMKYKNEDNTSLLSCMMIVEGRLYFAAALSIFCFTCRLLISLEHLFDCLNFTGGQKVP